MLRLSSMRLRELIIVIAVLLISACGKDTYDGYVYANKNNLSDSLYIGKFENLTDCRDSALAKLEEISSSQEGDYECGLNCDGSLCEDTVK